MKGIIETIDTGGRRCMAYVAPGVTRNGAYPWFVAACGDEMAGTMREIAAITEKTLPPFLLFAPMDVDWDKDYSPWPASDRFSGGAPAMLKYVTDGLIPRVTARYPLSPEKTQTGIVGYSLGGLFALYALYASSAFGMAASVSGSMWYPGFLEYVEARNVPERARAYLSLGKAESKTRAPAMASNADNAQRIASRFGDRGIFVWNNGNHFFEIPRRIAAALAWMLTENSPQT